ncbi:hypothetical protein NTE_03064 [Candidatus Nitrososphaera evergladensis SR1]|uniref:Uncharacterized protein n=1 Tax=Candidatus Nitrososphaera evergladensis SR1 TaxID=1459636 RepID=A0A075MVA8_9ARCH|nr:hypothetical protein NTE_03064 [Candidatus Nitrososphaera evergladensis SR1]
MLRVSEAMVEKFVVQKEHVDGLSFAETIMRYHPLHDRRSSKRKTNDKT